MAHITIHKFPLYTTKILNNKTATIIYNNNTYNIYAEKNPLLFKNYDIQNLENFIIFFLNSLTIKEKTYKTYKDFIYFDNDFIISTTKKYKQYSIKKIGLDTDNLLKFINMEILFEKQLSNIMKIVCLPQYFSIDIIKTPTEFYKLFNLTEYNIYNILSIIERDFRVFHINLKKEEELNNLIAQEKHYIYLKKIKSKYLELTNFLMQKIDNIKLYYIYLIFHFLNTISIYEINNLEKKYFFLLANLYLNYVLESEDKSN